MQAYTVTRYNGEITQFQFNQTVEDRGQWKILFGCLRECGFSQSEIEGVVEESWPESLKKHDPVQGTWISSDYDSHAASVDIRDEILRLSGFEANVEMFTDDQRKGRARVRPWNIFSHEKTRSLKTISS